MTTTIKINQNDGYIQHVATGGETSFGYDFPLFDDDHIAVYETDTDEVTTLLVKNTDYTVTGVNIQPGSGTLQIELDPILYPLGAPVDHKFTLLLNVPEQRTTDYNQAGDFFAETLNKELDLLTQQTQQLRRDVDRAATLPEEVNQGSLTLPAPQDGYIMRWNDSGGLENIQIVANSEVSLPALISSLADDDFLKYDSTTGFWQNITPAAARDALNVFSQDQLSDIADNIKRFGATGDGVTDDTTSIQNAIDDVSSNGGGNLLVPQGIYQVSSLTLSAGVNLIGDGGFASIIRTTSPTDTPIIANDGTKIEGIKFLSSVTRTGGYYIDIVGNGVTVKDCEFDGYYIAINAGVLGGSLIVSPLIDRCSFRTPAAAAGSGAVQFINFSNAAMRNCVMTGDTTPQADFGVRYQNGDTAFMTDTNITVHGKAILIDPPASYNCYALTVDSCLFDSAGTITGGSTVSNAEITPSGGVFNTKFNNCWFGLSTSKSGCYMQSFGVSGVDGIVFSGCEFTDNGDCGLLVVGTGVNNWFVNGGFSTANTNSGIRAAAGTSNFSITGHNSGNYSGRGPNTIGISIDPAASDNYIIDGCNVVGNTNTGIFDQGTGTNARVTNNLGYNGTEPLIGLTVGASPWTFTAGHTSETCYFSGGTVSSIAIEGNTVIGSTNRDITLLPNQSMVVTYSGLPTVLRKKI